MAEREQGAGEKARLIAHDDDAGDDDTRADRDSRGGGDVGGRGGLRGRPRAGTEGGGWEREVACTSGGVAVSAVCAGRGWAMAAAGVAGVRFFRLHPCQVRRGWTIWYGDYSVGWIVIGRSTH